MCHIFSGPLVMCESKRVLECGVRGHFFGDKRFIIISYYQKYINNNIIFELHECSLLQVEQH